MVSNPIPKLYLGSLSNTQPEVSDNGYRDGFSNLNNTEDSFRKDGRGVSVDQRKMNAVRAYFEWMPIRYVPRLSFSIQIRLLLWLSSI